MMGMQKCLYELINNDYWLQYSKSENEKKLFDISDRFTSTGF